MKILAIETSATAASCALCEGEMLLAQSFQHSGLTHSRTLMPMLTAMLENCDCKLSDVQLLAVAAGPGSFTGLRIGVSALKGLAWAQNLPCAAASTLAAMAWPLAFAGEEICCVMDARRAQVYNARFAPEGGGLRRLCEDRAVAIAELAAELISCGKPQILVGDGAQLCYNELIKAGVPVRLAPPNLRLQSAWGVAREALELAQGGGLTTAAALAPHYLRLPQAERERLEKKENE